MKRLLQVSFFVFSLIGFYNVQAQCTGTPITNFVVSGKTNVTCYNGSDGSISVSLTGGQAPFTYSLVLATGGGDIPIASVTNTNSQTATFPALFANAPFSGTYKVTVVTSNGAVSPPFLTICQTRIVSNVDVTQPDEITASVNTVSAACTTGTGAISLDVSGGTPLTGGPPNYVYLWSGPTAIPSTVEDPTNLLAGTYSVTIRDANYNALNSGLCEKVLSNIVVSSPPNAGSNNTVSACNTNAAFNLFTSLGGTPDTGGTWSQTSGAARTITGNNVDLTGAVAGAYTFLYTQTAPPCAPATATVTVNVAATPAPTATSPVTYCVGASALALSATGTNLLWYSVATGGTGSATAPTPSTAAAGTTSYYVSQTVATCESPRTKIDVVVNTVPAAPTATSPVTYCVGATANALSATGTNLLWYTVATGGTGSATAPTPSTAAAGTISYYVSQTVTGCESPRTKIDVVVNTVPTAPTATSPVTYCVGATANALSATGTNLLWYTVATGGTGSATAPTPSTAAAGTTSYYVSQTITGCESPRTKIDVVVNTVPAAPAATSPVTYCVGATTSVLSATGTNLLWYTVATGGTGSATAPTPSTAAAGTTSYYVSQTVTGCESPRTKIDVVVNAVPSAPIATTPVTYCVGAATTALTATGTNLLWYTVATGGTGSASAPIPSTAAAGTTSYYVSQTVTGCESPRRKIDVIVNVVPTAPAATSPVTYCVGATATALSATGTNLLWYTVASGGTGSATAPTPSTAAAGTTSYYVSQTVTGCESPRTKIDVVVNTVPTAPTATSPVTYCVGATASALSATGTNLLWYTVATGGTGSATVPTPSTAAAGTTSYYVSQTVTGCESPRTKIDVVVNTVPSVPTATTPVNYCVGATASALTATGSNLLWYTVASGGTGSATAPTPSTAAAGTTSYYVSQTVTGCESPRTLIDVIVNTIPTVPTVTSPVNYCVGATASALTATGTNLLWYTVATGGTGSATAPTPSTAAAGTTSYYVSQTVTGCESPRTKIDVVVNTVPSVPTATTPINYCVGATASALTATGSNLLWYTVASGGTGSATAPTPSTAAAGTTSYYVSQTVTGCESPRTKIDVIVNTVPTAPAATSPVTYCVGATAIPLTATGANLLWYTVATGGTGSATAPTPSTATAGTTSYYVSRTVTGCESPRRKIDVVVNAVPTAPAATSPVNYCVGATASVLSATGSNLLWYTVATGGTGSATAPTPSTAAAGTTSYYVSQTVTGCESPRTKIDVVINAIPTAPTVTSPVTYCVGATASTLSATGTNLLWYTVATGGTGSATALTPSTAAAGTTSYYVSQTDAMCGESPRAKIDIIVNAVPAAPTATTSVNYCVGATATALTATGSNLLWYTVATGGTGSATAPTPSTAAAGTTSYYVSQTVTGCESPRTKIDVIVNAAPTAPTVTSPVTYCVGATATVLSATGTNLLWYTVATGGTGSATAPTPSTAAAGATSYYVSQTVTGCESPRTKIDVVVNTVPTAPTATSPVNYCVGATASALSATGTNLFWYTVASGGTGSATAPTPSTAAAGTTAYYVSQTVTGCESPRTKIDVVVNAAPTVPTVTSPVNYCVGATASALSATGTNLLWYTVATGGTGSATAPTPSTAAAGTTSYYVSQTVTGCGESPRAQLDVVVNNVPTAPTATSPVTYCIGATASALSATGTNLLWYTVATGGTGSATAPTPSTAVAGTISYYVSQTVIGCESPRTKIDVVVNAVPATPTATSPVNYCIGATASSLSATGTNLLWYTVATGGTGSATAPTPTTAVAGTTSYYVSQTVTGCESPRTKIDVVVNAVPSAPTATTTVTYCVGATANALSATGTNLLWYTVATGGTGSATAPTPSTAAAGTTSYYVSQTTACGESPRTKIDVVVNVVPTAPAATSPVTYCVGATSSALSATGSNLLWYTAATGGTGSATAPTPSTVAAGTTSYYVSQTVTGCGESPRAQIDVVVSTTLSAPTATSPVTYCVGATASALSATGTNLLWYTAATGGTGSATAPTPSTVAAGTTSYYVSQTVTGCGESPRAQIDVVVSTTLSAPTATSPVTYCVGATASALSATGTNLLWYTVATGGTGSATAPTPSTVAAGTTSYYVSQTVTGCGESPRAQIDVVVSTTLSAPTATSPVTYCVGATASALSATGSNLLWYTAATGGTGSATAPTPSTVAAGTTSYYVSQTVTGCGESPRAQIDVVVSTTLSAPTATSPVTYCVGATASALSATGSNLLWYTAATGGTGSATAPTPSTVAAGTTSYYVSQTVTGCGESPRAQIDVVVSTTLSAPTATSPVTYCVGATASALSATGSNLLWYTVATGGTGSATAPTPSTVAAGTTSYYVSQTVTGCGESPRAQIDVVVSTTLSAPTATSPVTYCVGATASALSATGSNLLWYTAATGGTGSATAPTPSTVAAGTTSYYVSQTVTGCGESPRAQIDVVVSTTLSAPTTTSPVTYCVGATASALSATGSNLLWYTAATGGTGSATAPTPSTVAAGTTSYYVSQTVTGCGESPRAQIDVVVSTTLSAPAATSPVTYCVGATANALSATGSNLLWYTAATGGTGSATAPTPSTVAAGTTSYYVSQTVTGCGESPRAQIDVVVSTTLSAPTATSPVTYCVGATASALSATGTNLLWYTVATGGTGSATAPTPSTVAAGTTSYYVSQTVTGCGESPRAQIDVVVSTTLSAPTATSPVTYCVGATASALSATGSNLLWYTAATGGTGSATAPTPSTVAAGTTSYYVSQTVTGCGESPRAQIDVVVSTTLSAPTTTSPVTYCVGATASALSATGSNLLWYTAATGGTGSATAPTPSTVAAGTTSYYVSQTVTGCGESPRAQIDVVVSTTLSAPAATSPVTYCVGATANALSATGSNLLWYTAATGGTGSATAPTPSTVAAGTTSYYVSQTVTGCGESPRAQIDVVVSTTLSAPTATSPVTYCVGATASALSATGTNLLWYTVATGGTGSATAPTPSTVAAGTTSYYVSQTVTGCGESPRAQIDVVVSTTLSAPAATSPVTYCVGATANALSATGTNLLWYTVATGGTGSATAPTPSTVAAGTTSYYVSQTVTGCGESPRAQIDVVVSTTLSAPTATSPVTYCVGATSSALSATGSNLLWYTAATGGTGSATAPTPSTVAAGTTSYYVSQTVTGCGESPRAQIDVVVSTTLSAPTATSPVTYCVGATASALSATGTNLLWYTVATGGTGSATAPTPSTVAAGTTSYYVSQTVTGCGESPRAQIDVVVSTTLSAPAATSPVTYCVGATASALSATGSNLLWYTAATGGTGSATAPTPSTVAAGTTSYYVSQTVTGCGESPRAQIDVVVSTTLSAPTATSPVTYCVGATASALSATGSNLLWYTAATGGTGNATAPTPSTVAAGTTSYYVSQTVTGCGESPRAQIDVVVSTTLSAPTATSPVTYCVGATASALSATGSNLLWYTVATGGTGSATAPTPSTVAAGTTSYYVSQTVTGCGESPRAQIDVVVSTTLSAPTATSPVTYCVGATASALSATGSNLLWYTAATGGTGSATAPTPSTVAAGTTSYYVSQTVTGCGESPRAQIDVVVSNGPLCGGGTGTCATVVITPVPTSAQCTLSNGAINFTINPVVPTVNNTGVKITITGISSTNNTIARTNFNDPSFPALPIGVYTYSIEYGDVSCLKTGQVTIDQSGTVGTPSATNVVGPLCAGQSSGAVTLNVPGETGNILEWSLDGVLWNSFTAGNQIIGIPAGAAPSFQRVISVRRNSTDPCNAAVTITMQDQFTPITATITSQTSATCNNNDGAVLAAYAGGDNTAYTFELDGLPFVMPVDKIIKNLSGGNHTLKVIDNKSCSITLSGTQFFVPSPGLIQFGLSKVDPSCIGNGEDGRIAGAIFPSFLPGTYEVAITQQQGSNSTFKTVPPNGSIEFTGLSKGRYYITVRSSVNGCPNEQAIDIDGGPSRISFTQEMTCEQGSPVLKLSNINVVAGVDYKIVITKLGAITSNEITLSQIPAGGIYYIRGAELPAGVGDYEIKLVQMQSPTCTISSEIARYTNNGVLSVAVNNILPSYSDIATGAFNLTSFAGGTVPYYASIRFDSASNPINEVGFETDLEEVNPDPVSFGYVKKYNKLHAGRYHVTVNEEGGCSIEFDVRVPIDYTFSINTIPNVFTPNGDGVNDFFFIRNLPADAQLIISNRWGNQVYSSKSYQNDWNGGSAADGIYYYRLKAGDEVVTGWIEIQRGK